jgi:hypothetical protein
MEIAALILLVIFCALGFVFIFVGGFGTFVILAGGIVYAAMTKFSVVPISALLVLLALYLAGEVFEYLFIVIGAKKFGVTNQAVVGAIIGGIAGSIAGTALFGVGIFLGMFLGIFLGAFLVELFAGRSLLHSLKAGTGGVVGRVGALIAKVVIAVIMCAVLIISITV